MINLPTVILIAFFVISLTVAIASIGVMAGAEGNEQKHAGGLVTATIFGFIALILLIILTILYADDFMRFCGLT